MAEALLEPVKAPKTPGARGAGLFSLGGVLDLAGLGGSLPAGVSPVGEPR